MGLWATFLKYPLAAGVMGIVYIVGRVMYSVGYSFKAGARLAGAVTMDIALVLASIMGFVAAIVVATKGFGVGDEEDVN